jgi:outer membrane protein TolC
VIGLAVTLPIGGARRSAETAIARGEANIAAQRVRDVRLKVESDAQQAVLAMRSAHAQWQRLAAAAERTSTNAELVRRGYALGEFTTTELLTAQRQALDASLAAATAQLTAIESAARVQLDAHEIWSLESTADIAE